jgi:glutathione-specific gamma-glutamylcyclotransferase
MVDRTIKLTPDLVGRVHRLIPDTGPSPGFVHVGEADYDQLTDEILKDHLPNENLWIFAYGSLMWRPACEIDGQETAQLNGWHRKFCIRVSRVDRCPRLAQLPCSRGTQHDNGMPTGGPRDG